MTRRTQGPKHNAEEYAYRIYCFDTHMDGSLRRSLQEYLSRAWMAGYRAAARRRRKNRV